jgi:hypothetical protein
MFNALPPEVLDMYFYAFSQPRLLVKKQDRKRCGGEADYSLCY